MEIVMNAIYICDSLSIRTQSLTENFYQDCQAITISKYFEHA